MGKQPGVDRPYQTRDPAVTLNAHPLRRRGLMLVLSSPSGAGKTTIAHKILERDFSLQRSISITDRPARAQERDGIDYFFVTPERFTAMLAEGAFLEHTENHGIRYGTPKSAVEEALAVGQDLLFVIDVHGARFMRERVRKDVVSVFILPPSIAEQKHRLVLRGDDSEAMITRRLATTRTELPCVGDYDYVVMNDDLDQATARVEAILRAERQRAHRFTDLPVFVNALQDELKQAF